jgi:hypothetical protein
MIISAIVFIWFFIGWGIIHAYQGLVDGIWDILIRVGLSLITPIWLAMFILFWLGKLPAHYFHEYTKGK